MTGGSALTHDAVLIASRDDLAAAAAAAADRPAAVRLVIASGRGEQR